MRAFTTKHIRPLSILAVAALAFSLGGCGNDDTGWLEGRSFTMDVYSNTGELSMTSHASKVELSDNMVKSGYYSGSDSSGSSESGDTYTKSSVVTVRLDGREMDSCGDTLVFTEDGLEPVENFTTDKPETQDNEKPNDNNGLLNRYKDKFRKKHVVVIKSQTGTPLEAFAGHYVEWSVDNSLPKTTRIMLDGYALYIHRANFQIIDGKML